MQQGCCYKALTRCAVALFGLYFGVAQAATITVDDATDGSTANCTLRDAVAAANNDTATGGCSAGSGADTINFAATLNGQTIPVTNSGHIEITSDITIEGLANTPNGIILDANNSNRIFYVTGGSTLTVKGLTFQNGDVSGLASPNTNGGAIWVEATNHSLTIEDCHFANNKAEVGGAISFFNNSAPSDSGTLNVSNSTFSENTADSMGGAIWARNAATVLSSTFSENTASFHGGAIYANNDATVSSCTFSENTASFHGGAIYANNDATVLFSTFYKNTANYGGAIHANTATVSFSTFSENTADRRGGAIHANTATVSSSTFSENTAGSMGGAIYAAQNLDARHLTLMNNTASVNGGASIRVYGGVGGTTFALHNSIIVGAQSDAHCAVVNPTITGTYNLEWTSGNGGANDTSCSASNFISAGAGVAITDIVSTTLADNGGATETLALPANSPAIGAADKTVNGTSLMWDATTSARIDATLDQRGYGRLPVANGRSLGAYEPEALNFSLNIATLPDGTEQTAYPNTTVGTASDGTPNYTYSVTGQPNGMSLDSANATLSGTPTQSGDFTVTITAEDADGRKVSYALPLTIAPRALGTTAVPILPLPLLLILAGLLVGIGFRYRRQESEQMTGVSKT